MRIAFVMLFAVSYANAQPRSEVSSVDAGVYSGFRNLPISLDGISNKSFITSGNLEVAGSKTGYTALYSLQGDGTFTRMVNPVSGTSELPQLQVAAMAGIQLDNSGTKGVILSAESTTKLYKINTTTGLLEDVTANLPAAIQTISAPVITAGDIDNDGDDDIFFSRSGSAANGRVFLINDGSGVYTIVDVTADIPYLNNRSSSGAALFNDIDADGYPELLINGGDASGQTYLYKNNNTSGAITNTFSPVAFSPSLTGAGYAGAVFLNANNDNRPDIFITGQPAGGTSSQSIAQLWLNNGTGTSFAKSSGATFKGMRTAVTLLAADIDGDGKDDIIYCGNLSNNYDDPGNTSGGQRTVVYLNSNSMDGTYTEAVASDYFEGLSDAGVSYYIMKDMDANGDGNNDDFIVSKNQLTTTANNTGPEIFFYVLNSVLPVELKSFTVTAQNNRAKINWATLSEKNNARFEVESSIDGVNFNLMNSVEGKGNSNEVNQYTIYDNDPSSGTTYYRLLQYDHNGEKTNLGVRSVSFKINSNKAHVLVYPVPITNVINVKISTYKGKALFALIDMAGKIVQSHTAMIDTNGDVEWLLKDRLISGIYTFQITMNGIVYNQKVLVQ